MGENLSLTFIGSPEAKQVAIGDRWIAQYKPGTILLEQINEVIQAIDHQSSCLIFSRSSNGWSLVNGSLVVQSMSIVSKIKASSLKFKCIIRLLEIIQGLLANQTTATKRDCYYQDIALFPSQKFTDSLIEDLSCSFGVPRSCLGIVAASKGLVAGNIRFLMKNAVLHDCLDFEGGFLIPQRELIEQIG